MCGVFQERTDKLTIFELICSKAKFGEGIYMKTLRCRACKKTYEIGIGLPSLCPECIQKEKEEYDLVRSFVRDRPGVTVDIVERETKVERQKILRYIYDEKLEVYSKTESFMRCRMCGETIYTGILCDKCKQRAKG